MGRVWKRENELAVLLAVTADSRHTPAFALTGVKKAAEGNIHQRNARATLFLIPQ
jgi:hypothetical protein